MYSVGDRVKFLGWDLAVPIDDGTKAEMKDRILAVGTIIDVPKDGDKYYCVTFDGAYTRLVDTEFMPEFAGLNRRRKHAS